MLSCPASTGLSDRRGHTAVYHSYAHKGAAPGVGVDSAPGFLLRAVNPAASLSSSYHASAFTSASAANALAAQVDVNGVLVAGGFGAASVVGNFRSVGHIASPVTHGTALEGDWPLSASQRV